MEIWVANEMILTVSLDELRDTTGESKQPGAANALTFFTHIFFRDTFANPQSTI